MKFRKLSVFIFAAALACSASAAAVSAAEYPAEVSRVFAEPLEQESYDIALAQFDYQKSFVYDGRTKLPPVTVTYEGTKLTRNKDYTLSYASNTNVGTGRITVTGKGSFTGSVELAFEITAPDVAAPANLRCSDANVNIMCMRWDSEGTVSGFELECYVGGRWKKIATLDSAKRYYKYTDNALAAGTTYKIRIRSYRDLSGKRYYSPYCSGSATTDPAAVTNIRQTSPTTNGYTLRWDKVSGATGYKVYRWSPDTGKYEVIATVNGTSYTVTDRTPGQKNTYKVRAFRVIAGNSTVFHGALTAYKATSCCSVVPAIRAKTKLNEITVEWNAVNKASEYEVYYTDASGNNPVTLATVNNKTFSYTTTALPTGSKYKMKVKAISKYGTAVTKSKYPSGAVVRVFAATTYNQILDSYTNSSAITVTNGQGYTIPAYLKNNLDYQLNCLGGVVSFAMLDLESGVLISSNGKYYMGTASTVKMPYMLYCLHEMEDGYPTLDTTMVYSPEDYHAGSGIIQTYSYGTVLTLRQIFQTIFDYSDNIGFYMLQRMFGIEGYNKYISSIGCRTSMSWYDRWGVICATDSTKEWIQMYNYFSEGRYGGFMENGLASSTASNFRRGLGNKYRVYSKCGWTDTYHHDTTVVMAEHPYVLIGFTNRVSAGRLINLSLAADAIHDDLWRYFNSL